MDIWQRPRVKALRQHPNQSRGGGRPPFDLPRTHRTDWFLKRVSSNFQTKSILQLLLSCEDLQKKASCQKAEAICDMVLVCLVKPMNPAKARWPSYHSRRIFVHIIDSEYVSTLFIPWCEALSAGLRISQYQSGWSWLIWGDDFRSQNWNMHFWIFVFLRILLGNSYSSSFVLLDSKWTLSLLYLSTVHSSFQYSTVAS